MAHSGQNKLLLYLIMLLGLVFGYVYAGSADPSSAVPPLKNEYGMSTVQPLKEASIDKALIENDVFESLRVFGSLPVKPEAGGKDNPFQ